MSSLTELKELADRATPGPWGVFEDDYDKGTLFIGPANQDEGHYYVTGNIDSDPDARYIAACSPEVVKALVAVAEAAEAWLDDRYGEGFARIATRDALDALKEVLK